MLDEAQCCTSKLISDGGENRAANCLREFDGRKQRLRIEVVLAGLVDDAQLPVCGSVSVRNRRVQLPGLKRDLVASVPPAQYQRASSGHR